MRTVTPHLLAAVVVAGGCGGPVPASRPVPAAPAADTVPETHGPQPLPTDTVDAWLAPYRTSQPTTYEVVWHYTTDRGRSAGRGVVELRPPDSIRFEYRAPLGRRGTAVLVGSRLLWARPDSGVAPLRDAAPLVATALGLPPSPRADEDLSGQALPHRAWRYVRGDTVFTFLAGGAPHTLRVTLARGRRLVGSATAVVDSLSGRLVEGRVHLLSFGLLMQFTVTEVRPAPADPERWRRG